jgi:type II secretion system protein C
MWVVQLFLVFIGSYFLAKIASTFIASKLRIEKNLEVARLTSAPAPSRVRVGFDEYKIILERNVFDSREMAPVAQATPEPTQLDLNAPPVKTSLPIKLVSTFSVGSGTDKRSTATVIGGSGGGAGEIYTVEDEKQFSPGVKIVKILQDRIEFVNGARLEYAEIERFGGGVTTGQPGSALDKSQPPAKPGEEAVQQTEQGKFVVEKAELDAALGNLDQLFTQIRAVPQMQGGKSAGLKLLSIRGGSIFAKLGLRRNDVLERINGQEMDMQKGMQIFGTLKDSSHITIDLQRDGKKTTLEYDIQ